VKDLAGSGGLGADARDRSPDALQMLAWLASARTRSDFRASTLQQKNRKANATHRQ
jgi:hypothetical protein